MRCIPDPPPLAANNAGKSGITHGFVVDFANVEDRDYYVDHDPSHNAFKQSIGDLVENVIVVDFTDGHY